MNDPELQKATQASTVMLVVLTKLSEVRVLAAGLSLKQKAMFWRQHLGRKQRKRNKST